MLHALGLCDVTTSHTMHTQRLTNLHLMLGLFFFFAALGFCANDVETEQIVQDLSCGTLRADAHFSSYVQMRGSIPLFWAQEIQTLVPKPPITGPFCLIFSSRTFLLSPFFPCFLSLLLIRCLCCLSFGFFSLVFPKFCAVLFLLFTLCCGCSGASGPFLRVSDIALSRVVGQLLLAHHHSQSHQGMFGAYSNAHAHAPCTQAHISPNMCDSNGYSHTRFYMYISVYTNS